MTPEEACEYLGISLDDEDLYIDVIESNYKSKISECGGNEAQKAKIEEAHTILLEVYDELYGGKSDEAGKKNNEGLLMKLAVLMAVVFLLSFAGVAYFVYRIHTDSTAPKNDSVSSAEYDRVLRELEAIRNKQEEQPAPQIVINNPPADYATLVERVMPSMLFIQTDKGSGSGFFVSPNGDILTNYHVIDGAEYIIITTQDEQKAYALVKENDIQVMSYAPIARRDTELMSSPVLAGIAAKYGKTPAQIILRWDIDTGTVPIPASQSPEHIAENHDIFDFSLTDSEIKEINAMERGKRIRFDPKTRFTRREILRFLKKRVKLFI